MDENIREAMNRKLEQQGLTRSEWARRLGKHRQHVTELLEGRRGFVPAIVLEALDDLGLELVVREKGDKSVQKAR